MPSQNGVIPKYPLLGLNYPKYLKAGCSPPPKYPRNTHLGDAYLLFKKLTKNAHSTNVYTLLSYIPKMLISL